MGDLSLVQRRAVERLSEEYEAVGVGPFLPTGLVVLRAGRFYDDDAFEEEARVTIGEYGDLTPPEGDLARLLGSWSEPDAEWVAS